MSLVDDRNNPFPSESLQVARAISFGPANVMNQLRKYATVSFSCTLRYCAADFLSLSCSAGCMLSSDSFLASFMQRVLPVEHMCWARPFPLLTFMNLVAELGRGKGDRAVFKHCKCTVVTFPLKLIMVVHSVIFSIFPLSSQMVLNITFASFVSRNQWCLLKRRSQSYCSFIVDCIPIEQNDVVLRFGNSAEECKIPCDIFAGHLFEAFWTVRITNANLKESCGYSSSIP